MKAEATPRFSLDMAVAGKVVSKRSARVFVDDTMERQTYLYQTTTMELTSHHRATEEPESVVISSASSTTEEDFEESSLSAAEVLADIAEQQLSLDLNGQNELPQYFGLRADGLSTYPVPLNFGVVIPGVYRCSYPQTKDHEFIKDLGLKTIITLVEKEIPDGYQSFMEANGIRHHVIHMNGTKKETIPLNTMNAILSLVHDQSCHPLLIHCNHGKHRTGCVVAAVRKMAGWNLSFVIDEYKAYAAPKIRECDINYITSFNRSDTAKLLTWMDHVQQFSRVAIFACIALVFWMVSGSKLASGRPKLDK